jgi:hypothetical protein
MKRIVLALCLCLVGLAGCTKEQALDPLCKVANKAIFGAAQGIAEVLTCANPAVIAADIAAPIYKANLCQKEASAGLVGDIVCPQVSKTVIGIGLGTLPATWGCTGGSNAQVLEATLTDSCKKFVKF